ncbi:probable apyrase 7 isoform X1 [Salvia hispanica]|uniref:probable apyrase 7 isoform X1 n=2 Tax=Salvia hispanica TaxID=49212 RepID=UPI0020092D76|nr:probable apyrase 7 isoform X1 [Salvia hispanica]
MKPKSPSKAKIQIAGFSNSNNPKLKKVVIVSLLVILILGLVTVYLIIKHRVLMSEKSSSFFTVVLDCGSTGSRVNVFEWIGNGSGNLPILLHSYPENMNGSNGCQYHCFQTEPGLHNFVNDSIGVRASLVPLIRHAEQWVPLERRGVTPIFVLATAGMRRLRAEAARRVLGDVENVVKEHSFLHRSSWIRVLSGKEEAYYGWVALNYKFGGFGSSSRSPSLGLLDLGGSSLQVVAEGGVQVGDEHVVRSKIGPVEHDLAAYSLPAFGLNEAFDRTIVMLSHTEALRESGGGLFEVRHPCLGSGFVQNYTCRGCLGVDSRASRDLEEKGLNNVFLVGEPDWKRCEIVARAAAINSSSLEWPDQLNQSECRGLFSSGEGTAKLNLTKILHAVSRYHALSGFFAFHNVLNLSRRANLTMMSEAGQRLCSRQWSGGNNINAQNCFRVPYLTSLLANALCLSNVEIIFGPGDVSWTLGASLVEGDFPWHRAESSRDGKFTLKDTVARPSTILVFILLSSLLVIVYCCQIKLPMPGRKNVSSRTSLPSYLCPKRQPN